MCTALASQNHVVQQSHGASQKANFTNVLLRNNHRVAALLQPLCGKVSSRNVVVGPAGPTAPQDKADKPYFSENKLSAPQDQRPRRARLRQAFFSFFSNEIVQKFNESREKLRKVEKSSQKTEENICRLTICNVRIRLYVTKRLMKKAPTRPAALR